MGELATRSIIVIVQETKERRTIASHADLADLAELLYPTSGKVLGELIDAWGGIAALLSRADKPISRTTFKRIRNGEITPYSVTGFLDACLKLAWPPAFGPLTPSQCSEVLEALQEICRDWDRLASDLNTNALAAATHTSLRIAAPRIVAVDVGARMGAYYSTQGVSVPDEPPTRLYKDGFRDRFKHYLDAAGIGPTKLAHRFAERPKDKRVSENTVFAWWKGDSIPHPRSIEILVNEFPVSPGSPKQAETSRLRMEWDLRAAVFLHHLRVMTIDAIGIEGAWWWDNMIQGAMITARYVHRYFDGDAAAAREVFLAGLQAPAGEAVVRWLSPNAERDLTLDALSLARGHVQQRLRRWAEVLKIIDSAAANTATPGVSKDTQDALLTHTIRCLLAFDPEGALQHEALKALLHQVPAEFHRIEPGILFALQRVDSAVAGDFDSALAAAACEPDGATSRIALGGLQIHRGQWVEGAQVILNAAKDYPEDPRALLCAGWIALTVGEPESALTFATLAREKAPEEPAPGLLECQALAALGRTYESLGGLNEHVVRFPQDRSAWELLAQVAENTGDRAAARAAKKRASHLGAPKRE